MKNKPENTFYFLLKSSAQSAEELDLFGLLCEEERRGMDTHVKEGQLYVQHQKFGKKWKKNWFVLYPASQNGIARLEFFDSPSGGGGGGGVGGGGGAGTNEKTRKLDKKIIRLSECISILPAVTETCPKDNMAAFCVETVEKTHVFAAEKSVTAQWVEIMCDIAFQGGGGVKTPDCNGGPQDLQMSENLIYYSREEVNEFWVSVQRTEASERCSLSGSYWLKAEKDSLVLKEAKTKRNVLVWPYKLLRRYGRDRVMFSFEAGRRCDSGPGNFTFETKQGNEIFQLVEQAIKSQKALAEERHLSCPVTFDPDCPPSLQHLRSMAGIISVEGINNNSSREPDGDSGGSKPGSADGVIGRREGGDGGVRGQGLHKGRSLPDPPPMLGVLGGEVTPPRSPRHGAVAVGKFPVDEQSGVYSEPADSVRLPPPSADGLYSDPVDSIKKQNQPGGNPPGPMPTPRLRPVGDEGGNNQRRQSAEQQPPDQVYSMLYDQVNFELSQMSGSLGPDGSSNRRPPGGQAEGASSSPPTSAAEHIYDEPEGCAKPRAAPLAMSIYDEARPERWRRPSGDVTPASEQEGNYSQENSYSIPSAGKQYTQPYTHAHTHPSPSRAHPEPRGHSPPQCTPNRGGGSPAAPLTAPRWPKPTTAPKPGKGALPRKDLLPPPPVRPGGPGGNVNNNNGNAGSRDLYSKVSKIKVPPPNLWFNQQTNSQPVLRSPDLIYDNLGDI